MNDSIQNAVTGVVTILTAIIGLAIVAVILSKKSSTVDVINQAGAFFRTIASKAVSPVR